MRRADLILCLSIHVSSLSCIVVAQVIVTYHPDDVDAFIALADAIEVGFHLLLLLNDRFDLSDFRGALFEHCPHDVCRRLPHRDLCCVDVRSAIDRMNSPRSWWTVKRTRTGNVMQVYHDLAPDE